MNAGQTMEEIFQPFCDIGGARYAIAKPFVQRGYLYATDGRVAVCVPSSERDTIADGMRFPDMSLVMDFETVCTRPLVFEYVECDVCQGNGVTSSCVCETCGGSGKCGECQGSGKVTCYACNHDHDCEDCSGGGTCDECGGTGEVDAYQTVCVSCKDRLVAVEDGLFPLAIAKKIASLGDIKYTVKEWRGLRRIVFTAEGGIRGCALLK